MAFALAGDGRTLYFAFSRWLARIDLASRRSSASAARPTIPQQIARNFLDRGELIGVLHQRGLEEVAATVLRSTDGRSRRANVLDAVPVSSVCPTTGTVVGGKFYYIATAHSIGSV